MGFDSPGGDHGFTGLGGTGALGFWIFVAVVVVAMIWSGARQKAEKHETLRRIVEKTGTIDEEKLKELLAMVGYGLFFASRFAEPPADVRNGPPEP